MSVTIYNNNMEKDSFLKCVECHTNFDTDRHAPYLTPCLHACCLSCLNTITTNGTLHCKECMETFAIEKGNAQLLPVDTTRKNLAAFLRHQTKTTCEECSSVASGRCVECEEYLCDDCTAAHSKTKFTKQHQVILLEATQSPTNRESTRKTTCNVQGHEGQTISFFCDSKNCRRPVCTICMLKDHSQEQGHDVRNIADVYEDNKRVLEGHLVDLKYMKTKTDENLRNVETRREELEKKSRVVEDEIDTYFNMCMLSLDKRRNQLKEKLHSHRDISDIRLEQQSDNLKKQRKNMDYACRAGQDHISYSSQADFIKMNGTVISRIKEIEERYEQIKVLENPLDIKFIPKFVEEFVTKVKKIGDIWSSSDELDTNKLAVHAYDRETKKVTGKLRPRTITMDTNSTIHGTYDCTSDQRTVNDADLQTGEITCPEIFFDTTTTHVQNTVSDNKKSLTNQKPRRHLVRSLNHAFINYRGTIGTQPLGRLAQYYFEVQVHLFIKRQLRQDLIFEIGLSRKASIDKNYTIDCHPHSWVVCARKCNICRSVCLMAWHNNMKLCHQPIADICPPGTTHKAVYGFLLDTRFKQWVVMDAKNRNYLFRFRNVDVSRPLWPTFGVYNPDLVDVTLTLRSGRDIKTVLEIPFDS